MGEETCGHLFSVILVGARGPKVTVTVTPAAVLKKPAENPALYVAEFSAVFLSLLWFSCEFSRFRVLESEPILPGFLEATVTQTVTASNKAADDGQSGW